MGKLFSVPVVLVFIFLLIVASLISEIKCNSGEIEHILLDHDGGTDDFIALMVLLSLSNVRIEGIIVTPADCYIQPAVSATRKILRFFGCFDTEVSRGVLHGVASFPEEWRARAYPIDALPLLNYDDDSKLPPLVEEAGHEYLHRKLMKTNKPLTVVVTGPLTNLGNVLDEHPEIVSKIKRVVWMGGAFEVAGNVKDFEHDGSAEWNAYWDPFGVAKVWKSNVQIIAFPCDVTNNMPVTKDLLLRLSKNLHCDISHLAGQMYALTTQAFPRYSDQPIYYMWDTLTALSFGMGDMISYENISSEVVTAFPSMGKTRKTEEGVGRHTTVATDVNPGEAYSFLINLFDDACKNLKPKKHKEL